MEKTTDDIKEIPNHVIITQLGNQLFCDDAFINEICFDHGRVRHLTLRRVKDNKIIDIYPGYLDSIIIMDTEA